MIREAIGSRRKTVAIAALTFLATIGLAAVALTYWPGGGAGVAQTRLGDPLPLVLSPGTSGGQLYPGGDASVAVVATNPNPYSMKIASLALDGNAGVGGFEVDAEHQGCAVSSLAFATQDNGGDGWSIPPRAGNADGELPVDMAGALTMSAGAAAACQGAVFTVHVVAFG